MIIDLITIVDADLPIGIPWRAWLVESIKYVITKTYNVKHRFQQPSSDLNMLSWKLLDALEV